MVARSLLFVATLAAVGSLRAAATRTWTGAGGDNEWPIALNWAGSAVPGNGDTAVFENTGVLSLRINRPSGYDVGATHFKFLGADVAIGSDDAGNALFFFGSSTCTVEVVAGTTVTCSNYVQMYNSDNIALAKKGGGIFRHVYKNNYIASLNKLVVEGGRMGRAYLSNNPHQLPPDKNIHVGEGADYFSFGYTSFDSNGGGLSLDGGTFTAGLGGVSSWWLFGTNGNRRPDVEIGEGGGTLRAVDYRQYNSDNCIIRMYSAFKPASGVSDDGGVTIDLRDCGVGFMPLAPFSASGPVTVKDGRLLLAKYGDSEYPDLGEHPSFFGTGDFALDSSVLDYTAMSGTDLPESTLRLASGAGSQMTVRGASTVSLRESTSKNRQHIVVGPDGATAGAAFVRERGAALFLCDAYGDFDGSGSTFKVSGGMGAEAETLVRVPIFVTKGGSGHVGANFVRYDEDKGFVEFTDYYTASLVDAGENSVVGNQYPSLAANAAAHVAGVRLPEWGTLTLNAGSCLTIGNGTDPACLLLGYEAKVSGTGTINFGNSEGVITIGTKFYDDGGHGLPCRLTGSGGVSYLASAAYGKRVANVSGANDYTGDTHISVATILPRNELAFSSGDVYVEGGYRNGGKIAFDRPLTFANAFHVSGTGHRAVASDIIKANVYGYGALTFLTNDVVLTGAVELTAKTEVSAMPSGASGTFAGVISGDRLVVRPGEGRVVLAANNTYTGGTEVVSAKIVLTGASPSLGTGRVKLDDGIVLFENTSPIAFANMIEGTGTFKVRRAAVTFTVPQIKGGSPTVATAGTRVEFVNGVARVIQPPGMAIVFR